MYVGFMLKCLYSIPGIEIQTLLLYNPPSFTIVKYTQKSFFCGWQLFLFKLPLLPLHCFWYLLHCLNKKFHKRLIKGSLLFLIILWYIDFTLRNGKNIALLLVFYYIFEILLKYISTFY